MKILVTGAAGFIGFHVVQQLLAKGYTVVGLDNINDYYSIDLKYDRLAENGFERADVEWNKVIESKKDSHSHFIRMNLEEKKTLVALCEEFKFNVIVHLAAQAGVRYSITNPDVYVQSNVVGFLNILEVSRNYQIEHLIYASSSSVYGLNEIMPFSTDQPTNHPVSLYAATKKSNELMAHTYSHLFNIPTSGLRFFTVYGPWGRPDMAYFLFAEAIKKGKAIKVFNHGKMKRDFTYIDDIVDGIIKVIDNPAKPDVKWNNQKPDPSISSAPYRVYNLGNNKPVELLSFIQEIESNLGQDAVMDFIEMQDGDVPATWANIDGLSKYGYSPNITIKEGIKKFIKWYSSYYQA